MIHVRVDEGERSRIVELDTARAPAVIGRGRESDLDLGDGAASRRHCAIEARDGEHWLRDLGSKNGTKLNGRDVRGETPLGPGDRIEIGDAFLTFLGEPPGRDDLERDAATGRWSFPYFVRELRRKLETARALSILRVEVDGHAIVSDVLGAGAGDRLTAIVGRELDLAVAEAGATDAIVAKEPGERFAVLLPHAGPDAALAIAERASARLDRAEGPDREGVTASTGVASFPEDATSFRTLLERADAALARARRLGGARALRFHPDARESAKTKTPLDRTIAPGRPPAPSVLTAGGRKALALVARLLESDLALEGLVELALTIVLEAVGAERAFLILREPSGELSIAGACDPEERSAGVVVSRTVVRAVVETGEAVLVSDTAEDAALSSRPSVVAARIRAVLAAPVVAAGEVRGVIYLDRTSGPTRFKKADRDLVVAFGRLAGGTLRRSAEQGAAVRALGGARLALDATDEAEARRALRYPEIVGRSSATRALLREIELAAVKPLPVLVTGGVGAGKEIVARAIHRSSGRKGPFVAENLSSIHEQLLEVELFGCKKGAYTGADRDRIGLFEAAHGGTLFLDEVSDLSPAVQAKLLRVLEAGEVRPLGDDRPRAVEARVIAGTSKDLAALVAAQSFRKDLYYRLAVLRVAIPPLRERRADIPQLARHFLVRAAQAQGVATPTISPAALRKLAHHDWPGNVRELENEVRKLVALGKRKVTAADLSPEIGARTKRLAPDAAPPDDTVDRALLAAVERGEALQDVLSRAERTVLERVLAAVKGNRSAAARRLGLSRPGLYGKLHRYGLAGPP